MADVMVLQGIRQRYGGGDSPLVEVLHGIDLKLPEGGFSALIGPSGSGKSTLLNIIGLLESPSEGQLWLAGEQASGQNDRVRTALDGHLCRCGTYPRILTAIQKAAAVMAKGGK